MLRRSLAALGAMLAGGGCGRLAFDRVADVDADVVVDAAVLRETLSVPGNGTPTASTTTLALGVRYTLRVSGTFFIGGGSDPYGDAEYWNFAAGARDLCDDAFTDAGLSIDDPTVDGMKQPHWGAYQPDHIYTIDVIGKGAPISAKIHDVAPGNNSGMLTLEIFEY